MKLAIKARPQGPSDRRLSFVVCFEKDSAFLQHTPRSSFDLIGLR